MSLIIQPILLLSLSLSLSLFFFLELANLQSSEICRHGMNDFAVCVCEFLLAMFFSQIHRRLISTTALGPPLMTLPFLSDRNSLWTPSNQTQDINFFFFFRNNRPAMFSVPFRASVVFRFKSLWTISCV